MKTGNYIMWGIVIGVIIYIGYNWYKNGTPEDREIY